MLQIGYAATTVDHIALESRVSRKAIYTHFTGKEDLLLQAHRAVVEKIATGAGPAIAERSDWRSALRALLDWSLEFFAREPAFAHLSLVEMPAATPASRRLQRESLAGLRRMIAPSADRELDGSQPTDGRSRIVSGATIDAMLGGMLHVVADVAENGRPADLPALRPQLMAWFALVLEGPGAAEEELAEEVSISPTLAPAGPA
ncbi:MAG: TetR/AcrR family transcriptional regulator [Thermoleophilaceae bacterium]